jgi:protoheme IX farnesyltransferase
VDVLALFLFLVIFYWTPPHTWALGLLIRTDYERVNIPMLPVVVGETETRRQILLYTLQMIAVTLLLFAFHMMGWLYFVAALVLNAVFLARALQLWRLPETDKALAKRLYKFSQSYLALLFLAMVLMSESSWPGYDDGDNRRTKTHKRLAWVLVGIFVVLLIGSTLVMISVQGR